MQAKWFVVFHYLNRILDLYKNNLYKNNLYKNNLYKNNKLNVGCNVS
jgi:hypothetical protein